MSGETAKLVVFNEDGSRFTTKKKAVSRFTCLKKSTFTEN